MIKAVIIDDEPSAVSTLSLMLRRYIPEIKDIKSTTNPQEALQLLTDFQPHIVFLDIQMPEMNGFELLKKMPQINFDIIFTTAYDRYAIEAIRFSALYYLLKPIDADELRAAVGKFITKEALQASHQPLYNNLINNLNAKSRADFKLALPGTKGTDFFSPEEIVRLEGENNYTNFFFTNRKNLLVSKTLKEYEELLNAHGFIRTHKSHIINKKHVISYTRDGMLTMMDTSKVEISRRRREEVMEALKTE